MRTGCTARDIQRRANCNWLAAPWAVRLWLAPLYLIFFYVWFVCVNFLFGTPRTPQYHAFWTEANHGGLSLLGITTAIHVCWAVISAIDIVCCFYDRKELFRGKRIVLQSINLALFVSYIIIVRTSANAVVFWGPAW